MPTTVTADSKVEKFTIYQGATWRTAFTYKTGTPLALFDFTGCTARMQIKDDDGVALITLTNSAGITLGGALGTVVIEATDEQTALLTETPMHYDLLIEAPSGDVARILMGTIKVSPRVTVPA